MKETEVSPNSPTYPWTSMAEFATHLLFSSPRLRFSEQQKKSVLSWATALGAHPVPSMYSLGKTQERIKALFGDPKEKVTSASGNIFYLNSVSKAIAMDYANPLVRFSMQDYPEDGQGRMSQVHHGEKMLEDLPNNLAPPCVAVGINIFFVNELLQRSTKGYFIPKKFFQAKLGGTPEAEVLAAGHGVSRTEEGYAVDTEVVIVLVSTGRMVFTVPLIVFMDDVSGNISKQWNKHHVVYMSNASMPCEMLEKEFCVRFVSSSPHAPPLELIGGVRKSIEKAADDGIIAWDCKLRQEVMLIPYKLFLAGDNPMQAEECSHGGLKCNYFCRTCKVGGTTVEKKSDEGYCKIFESGELRTPSGTLADVKEQIELAKKPGGTDKVKNAVSKTGTRDAASTAIVDRLLDLGKRLRKREAGTPPMPELEDTPIEILHTILLGVVKYYWGQTVYILDKAHLLDTFQTRLESVNKDGLNSPTLHANYITVLKGWTVIGELVVLLWHTEIDNIEDYLANLSRTIEDFLSISAQCAPSILLTKAKFHFLLHLPMFIRRFGPAILFSTERFESFNHVFCLASIYSNRQAPSRDTCQVFAEQDAVKHIVTGEDISVYMASHPHQCRLMGIPAVVEKEVGKFPCKNVREVIPPIDWHTTQSASIQQPNITHGPNDRFYQGKTFITVDGDNARIGGHVIWQSDENPVELSIGKITEVLIPADGDGRVASHVLVMQLDFQPKLHAELHVPCLKLSEPEKKVVLRSKNVLCNVNIQHDCATSRCTAVTPPEIHAQGSTTHTINHNAVHMHAAKVSREKKGAEAETALSSKEMMITVHADMLELHARQTKSQAEQFIESEEFKVSSGQKLHVDTLAKLTVQLSKDILRERLRVCLLSPNLTAYVQEVANRIFAYAKQHLSTFKIPEAALEDPEMTEQITSLISHLLTSARSNMKQKIANHIASKSHISVLAKSLSPGGGYEMTTAHWAHIAFLRDSMIIFKSVVEESEEHAAAQKKLRARQSALATPDDAAENEEDQEPAENDLEGGAMNAEEKIWTSNEYWEYVDKVLRELRAEACAAETTAVARAKHMEAYVCIFF
ncbi:hypothetical protein BU15DRAFT_48704 [Melanogaster broomeanus]|nr:hypothetical protein BU15DRAFT_48704 [Melanogaster broomeanus]